MGLLEDKQTPPQPKVKPLSMNPYYKKAPVKLPAGMKPGKSSTVGNKGKGRGSKIERA
jgi:hypothetical protein